MNKDGMVSDGVRVWIRIVVKGMDEIDIVGLRMDGVKREILLSELR